MKSWKLALAVGLLSLGGVAQAGLMSYTVNGVDLVLDGQGLTWTADANLFKSQYDDDNTVVDQIIAAVPTVTHTPSLAFPSPYTVTAADFNTGNGLMSWFGAMAWAEWLGLIGYGGADDWRLWQADPSCGQNFECTDNELGYLFYTEGGLNPGDAITDSALLDANQGGAFTNLQNFFYWSGTEYAPDPDRAWDFSTDNGVQANDADKDFQDYGWAVRPGKVGTAPLPGTAVLMALGLFGLGARRRVRRSTLALR